MRNRFILIILTALILAAVAITTVHGWFFKNQRINLIQHQITESSEILLTSPEFLATAADPSKIASMDDTITKVLREKRIGKVFVLRDENNKILYQNVAVSLLQAEIPTSPEWAVVRALQYVHVRNIKLPGQPPRTLQVGLALDHNFLDWEVIDSRFMIYVAGIVVALFLAAVLLTLILLEPLRLLIAHLNTTTSHMENLRDVRPLPNRLMSFTGQALSNSDEFSSLLSSVQKLINRINLNYKLTRSWTLQMAHELKTPLAIMQAETEAKQKALKLPASFSENMLREIGHMSDTISQFLEWAELESSLSQKNLHAIRIKSLLKDLTARLEKISPGRLQLIVENDFSVFANPVHLEQLVMNLVSNALKFSPAHTQVEIFLNDHNLIISDSGSGIPEEVHERIGQPFNIGMPNKGGNGLGLAWVSTIAKIYNWQFDIVSGKTGTRVSVHFPEEETSSI